MHQQDDMMERYKRNLNTTFNVCEIYRRMLIIPLRNRFGVEFLGGARSLIALIILVCWSGFSQDIYMWGYTGFWLLFFVHRRIQSVKMQDQVHSQYDGWPVDAIRICKDERKAKLIIEPVIIGLAGAFAYWLYGQYGWSPKGLPYFLICGSVIMMMIEMGNQAAWKRRVRGLNDAQIEQEQLVRELHDQNNGR